MHRCVVCLFVVLQPAERMLATTDTGDIYIFDQARESPRVPQGLVHLRLAGCSSRAACFLSLLCWVALAASSVARGPIAFSRASLGWFFLRRAGRARLDDLGALERHAPTAAHILLRVGLHESAGARDRRVILIMRDNVWYADSIPGVRQSLPTLRSASLTAET